MSHSLFDAISDRWKDFWHESGRPQSFTTGKTLEGCNRILLPPGKYMSFKEIKHGHVRKGEKAYRAVEIQGRQVKTFPLFESRQVVGVSNEPKSLAVTGKGKPSLHEDSVSQPTGQAPLSNKKVSSAKPGTLDNSYAPEFRDLDSGLDPPGAADESLGAKLNPNDREASSAVSDSFHSKPSFAANQKLTSTQIVQSVSQWLKNHQIPVKLSDIQTPSYSTKEQALLLPKRARPSMMADVFQALAQKEGLNELEQALVVKFACQELELKAPPVSDNILNLSVKSQAREVYKAIHVAEHWIKDLRPLMEKKQLVLEASLARLGWKLKRKGQSYILSKPGDLLEMDNKVDLNLIVDKLGKSEIEQAASLELERNLKELDKQILGMPFEYDPEAELDLYRGSNAWNREMLKSEYRQLAEFIGSIEKQAEVEREL